MSKKHLESNLKNRLIKFSEDMIGIKSKNASAYVWENVLVIKFDGTLPPFEMSKTTEGAKSVSGNCDDHLERVKKHKLQFEKEFGIKPEHIHCKINKDRKMAYVFYIMEDNYN